MVTKMVLVFFIIVLQREMEGVGQQQAPQADFLAVFGLTLGFFTSQNDASRR